MVRTWARILWDSMRPWLVWNRTAVLIGNFSPPAELASGGFLFHGVLPRGGHPVSSLPNVREGTISAKVPSNGAEEIKRMNFRYIVVATILLVSALTACTKQQESPEQIRQQTAQATAEAKSDAKAVAEGLREGWNRDRRLNLNSASKEQLQQLPGISDSDAARVIAGRPYESSDQLVSRHIISRAEYDRIADRVEAK